MNDILKRTIALVSVVAVIVSTCGSSVQAAMSEKETEILPYQVVVEDCVNGILILDRTEGFYKKEEVVEVTASPEKGYQLKEIKVTPKEKTLVEKEIPVEQTEQGICFRMPDDDIVVSGVFVPEEMGVKTGQETEEQTETEQPEKVTETKTPVEAEPVTETETRTEAETKSKKDTTGKKETETMQPETDILFWDIESGRTNAELRTTNEITIQVENNRLDWFKAYGPGWFSQTKPQVVLYKNGTTFKDGMTNKSSYCLYSSYHSPEGNYHPNTGKFLSTAINYALYYGNRAYGETAYDAKYSAGDYYKDYYITSMAIHYLNGEMGNEPLMEISDAHIASLGDPVATDMYQKYRRLISDAKKAASSGHEVLDNTGRISNAEYVIEGNTTQSAWKVDIENGGYRTKNNYKVSVSDVYAFDIIKGIKPVNTATGETEPGTSVKFISSKINSDFYIHVTDAAYQRIQKNQTKLKAVITGTTHTLSGTRYDPENTASISGDPLQPVIFMEWDTEKTDVKFATVYAEPPKQENGKAKIKKISSNPAITDGNSCYSLEGTEFKIMHPETRVEVAERLVTKADGESQEISLPTGEYLTKEVKAPRGFKLDETERKIVVEAGKTTILEVENKPTTDPVALLLKKIDAETGKEVVVGNGTFEGAEYTIKYYDGQYQTEKELDGIQQKKIWVLKTNKDGILLFNLAEKVSGDEFYYDNMTGIRVIPLGTITIQETKAPSGYKLDPTLYIRNFEAEPNTGELITSLQAVTSPEPYICGGVQIEKWDSEINADKPQGGATLEGTVIQIINRSTLPVPVEGKLYQPGEVVKTVETNKDGKCLSADDLLPYGSYEAVEISPPAGYQSTGKLTQTFEIRNDKEIVVLTGDQAIKNEPIRGGVEIHKWDQEINADKPQGGATLEGTVIQILNKSQMAVLVEGKLYQPEEVVKTVETNKDGSYTSKNDLLPYGTYEAIEVSPPAGYQPTGKLSQIFEIRKDQEMVVLTGEKAIKNEPIRGDLKGIKVSDGDQKRMSGVPFKLTSKTTKESHIVITDENGMFSTASAHVPHSQNTNRGQTAEDGVWFGSLDALDDNKGALLYDTYRFEELPCEANADKVLLKPFDIVIKKNRTVIDLGTITNDYKPKPEIGTTATDQETGGHTGYVNEKTTIVDLVEYVNLIVGKTYVVDGVVMDRLTGKPFLINGKEVRAKKTFTAEQPAGSIELEFTFDSTSLKGKEVVIFETLYQDGKEVAVHADLKDKDQTVKFEEPKIGTTATDQETGGHKGYVNEKTTIVDLVEYVNLIVGKTYIVDGVVMDQLTGKPLLINGKEVRAKKTFTAEQANGSIELEFTFDSSALKGKEVVIFETLSYEGREIAVHADLKDKNQTVKFEEPKIGTTATDKETGKHEGYVNKETIIVDLVEYVNLIVGKTYVVDGVVMDLLTGKPLLVNGKEVRVKKTFTAEKPNGSIELEFTFDSSALKGKEVVIFETLSYEGREIAVHADLKDKNQTVKFEEPKIGTTATDKETGKHEGYVNKETTIVDLVEYVNLIVGKTYVVDGIVMDLLTGKPFLANGKEVRAKKTFTAEKPNGSIELEFTFDSTALKGKKVVVFETLSYEGREIASHTDLKDKNQTVRYGKPKEPVPPTTPTTPPTGTPPTKINPPKTGDNTNIIVWAVMMAVAAFGLGGGIYWNLKRKRRKEHL